MHIIESFSPLTIKKHNALDVNYQSDFDILHGHTVYSNGKFSLQVVRNSDSFFQNHITCKTIIEPRC